MKAMQHLKSFPDALQLHKGSQAEYQERLEDLQNLPALLPAPLLPPPLPPHDAPGPLLPLDINTLAHHEIPSAGTLSHAQKQPEALHAPTSPARKVARTGSLPQRSGRIRGLESPFVKATGNVSFLGSGPVPVESNTALKSMKPPLPAAGPQPGTSRPLRPSRPGNHHVVLQSFIGPCGLFDSHNADIPYDYKLVSSFLMYIHMKFMLCSEAQSCDNIAS